jgi:hypothetical protein
MHDNSTAHASEFGEGQSNTFPDSIPELGAPTGFAIGSKTVMLVVFWRNCAAVCYFVGCVRVEHVSVESRGFCRRECDSIVDGGVDVMQDIESSIPGAPGRFVVICGQKRVCDCQVQLSTAC